MNQTRINKIQNTFFEVLNEYYSAKGFIENRKDWSFSKGVIKIQLYVDTKIGSYYTIRPGLEITFKNFLARIKKITSSLTSRPFSNGHFFLSQKLANVFGVSKYDNCQENSFDKYHPVFRHTLETEEDATFVATRHMEIMNDFGCEMIKNCEEINAYYLLIKRVLLSYLDDIENNPNKRVVEYHQSIDLDAYLTLIMHGTITKDVDLDSLMERIQKLYGQDSLWSTLANKIVNTYS